MNTVLEGRLIRMAYQDKCPQKHNINLLLNLAGTMVLNISHILTSPLVDLLTRVGGTLYQILYHCFSRDGQDQAQPQP